MSLSIRSYRVSYFCQRRELLVCVNNRNCAAENGNVGGERARTWSLIRLFLRLDSTLALIARSVSFALAVIERAPLFLSPSHLSTSCTCVIATFICAPLPPCTFLPPSSSGASGRASFWQRRERRLSSTIPLSGKPTSSRAERNRSRTANSNRLGVNYLTDYRENRPR